MRAQGKDVVHFGFGQSPFPVPPPMVEAMAAAAGEKDYLPAAGLPELRAAAASYFEPLLGSPVDPARVLVGPGSKTLLFHALFCHAGPLVLAAGSWVSYGPQAALLSKPCHVLEPTPAHGFKLDPAALDATLGALGPGHQAMVLVNSPNNPTGEVYQEHELAALAEVLRRHDALALADEIYGQVLFEGAYRSLAQHAPERTLITTGLSKAFSAGGYRLGLLIVPEALEAMVAPLVNLATETYSSVTCAVQRAGVLAYSHHPEVEAHLADCNLVHGAVVRRVAGALRAGGVDPGEPGGAFYLFPGFESRRQAASLTSSDQLAERLLEEHRVATLPGTAFLAPPELLHVRISPVDYDGAHALAVLRNLRTGGLVDPDELVRQAAPRVLEGVRRLLALGG